MNKLMADITLFWCFWKNKILDRMMEFQVKFCYHSGLRLWRTGMLFSTKFKGHKSKFRFSWMYRYHSYDLKVHFWWPNKRFFWCRSSSNTLYISYRMQIIYQMKFCKILYKYWTCDFFLAIEMLFFLICYIRSIICTLFLTFFQAFCLPVASNQIQPLWTRIFLSTNWHRSI